MNSPSVHGQFSPDFGIPAVSSGEFQGGLAQRGANPCAYEVAMMKHHLGCDLGVSTRDASGVNGWVSPWGMSATRAGIQVGKLAMISW